MTKTNGWRVMVTASCLVAVSVLVAQSPEPPRRLLFLTHASLYQHASLEPAERSVTAWGEDAWFAVTGLRGFAQESSNLDLSMISADYLDQFDGIMMFTNGNLPMDDSQRRAITDFVRGGKGFIGVHSASLTFYDHPEFGDMLGGYFRRAIRQGHLFVLNVENRDHPATRMLGSSWPIVDEFYLFSTQAWSAAAPDENRDELFGNPIVIAFFRDRVRVLLSIDTELTDMEWLEETGMEKGGDYKPGAGCSVKDAPYNTAIGHRADIWTHDPVFRAHITGGIRWALGLESGDATPLGE